MVQPLKLCSVIFSGWKPRAGHSRHAMMCYQHFIRTSVIPHVRLVKIDLAQR